MDDSTLDEDSREITLSIKKPFNIESLKQQDPKELKGKKTELKRIEKEQKRAEK